MSAGSRSPGRERDRGGDAALERADAGHERHRPESHRPVERREGRDCREARDREPHEAALPDAARVVGEDQRNGQRQHATRDAPPAEHADGADDARRARIRGGRRAPQQGCQQPADDPRHACVPAITATPSEQPRETTDLAAAEPLAQNQHAADDRDHGELRGEHRRDGDAARAARHAVEHEARRLQARRQPRRRSRPCRAGRAAGARAAAPPTTTNGTHAVDQLQPGVAHGIAGADRGQQEEREAAGGAGRQQHGRERVARRRRPAPARPSRRARRACRRSRGRVRRPWRPRCARRARRSRARRARRRPP